MHSYAVLGPLEISSDDGVPVAVPGDRQRGLVAMLLAHGGRVVAADALAEALFADRPPANPTAALHSQIARLRRVLGDAALISGAHGYAIRAASTDADRFETLLARARQDPAHAADRLGDALALWRGPAYVEFPELEAVRLEAMRLDELRLGAVEDRADALTAAGRAGEAVPELEPFVAVHPLRERARAALMRALYAGGRHAEALRHYAAYRKHLADELGTGALGRAPTPGARHPAPRDRPARPEHSGRARPDGGALRPAARRVAVAVATVGDGPPLVAVPAWVTSLDLVAAGRDPRASLLERLARRTRLTLYDRLGTGLSRGPVPDHGLEASAAELEAVLEQARSGCGAGRIPGRADRGGARGTPARPGAAPRTDRHLRRRTRHLPERRATRRRRRARALPLAARHDHARRAVPSRRGRRGGAAAGGRPAGLGRSCDGRRLPRCGVPRRRHRAARAGGRAGPGAALPRGPAHSVPRRAAARRRPARRASSCRWRAPTTCPTPATSTTSPTWSSSSSADRGRPTGGARARGVVERNGTQPGVDRLRSLQRMSVVEGMFES